MSNKMPPKPGPDYIAVFGRWVKPGGSDANQAQAMEAAKKAGSTFENNKPFMVGDKKMGFAKIGGKIVAVDWGSVAGEKKMGEAKPKANQKAQKDTQNNKDKEKPLSDKEVNKASKEKIKDIENDQVSRERVEKAKKLEKLNSQIDILTAELESLQGKLTGEPIADSKNATQLTIAQNALRKLLTDRNSINKNFDESVHLPYLDPSITSGNVGKGNKNIKLGLNKVPDDWKQYADTHCFQCLNMLEYCDCKK